MAENERRVETRGECDLDRKFHQSGKKDFKEKMVKVKEKSECTDLPSPPPDPWSSSGYLEGVQGQSVEIPRPQSIAEEEDIIAYLTGLGTPPFEGQISECPSRNSATSNMPNGLCTEDPFEHLDKLYNLTEQILDLRSRNARFFRRVRDLEKLKVLRKADRKVERAVAIDDDSRNDFPEEDTGFAESLLDAILSNGRDPQFQRRNIRSPSSRRSSRPLGLPDQSFNSGGRTDTEKLLKNGANSAAPKVSKWTRVKAAFKWEKACTNDVAESAETTPTTPTTKYLTIPEVAPGSSCGSSGLSPSASEISSTTSPVGRPSSASSSNEDVFDGPRKVAPSRCNSQLAQTRDDRRRDNNCTERRSDSIDGDTTSNADFTERTNESVHGRPLIRITLENDPSTKMPSNTEPAKETLSICKKASPTLTIAIPSNEEDFRSVSSPESMSPLPSSAMDSGESSPQRVKERQDTPTTKEFKRQCSVTEASSTPVSRMQRQDSKWNKVRRAFLTNAAFSVPPSPVRVMAGQSFLQEFPGSPRAYSCSGSVEDLDKPGTMSSIQAETRRDYQALREKLGAEFHRKLVEWERLKGSSPRGASRNIRDGTGFTVREGVLIGEDRLTPEFKKKLQEWKRAKKGRRGSISFERQRVSRRRLTDWQLWRSSSKPESRSQSAVGVSIGSGNVGPITNTAADNKPHLCEDFVRRMEAWRRINEAASRKSEASKAASAKLPSSLIDESEFLALDRILPMCSGLGRRESQDFDSRRIDEHSTEEIGLVDESRNRNGRSEIYIRTSVGSYRFEGISREFTRKLYDWERYRGISPRSSTFRLLGPAYAPFVQHTNEDTPMTPSATETFGGEEEVLLASRKRSKSLGNIAKASAQKEKISRRSTSLQSLNRLANTLNDADQSVASPTVSTKSITAADSQRTVGASADAIMDDSEPEAVIVDIEDVIEETASPLKRVQPHQTPVYSVAASETTSIAVPLGTVTSSHEPSPVILVEAEESPAREHWESRARSQRTDYSSKDDQNLENWEARANSLCDGNQDHWEVSSGSNDRINFSDRRSLGNERWNDQVDCFSRDNDSMKSYHSVCSFDWFQSDQRDALNEAEDEAVDSEIQDSGGCGGLYESYSGGPEIAESVASTHGSTESVKDNGSLQRITQEFERHFSMPSCSTVETMDLPSEIGGGCESENENERTRAVIRNDSLENVLQRDEDEAPHDGDALLGGASYGRVQCGLTATAQPAIVHSSARTRLSDLPADFSVEGNEKNRTVHYDITKSDEGAEDLGDNYDYIMIKAADEHQELFMDSPDLHEYEQIVNMNPFREQQRYEDDREKIGENSKDTFASIKCVEKENYLAKNSLNGTLDFCESTVKTQPLTMSMYHEARSFERILINEKTLNKVVVPTSNSDTPAKESTTNEELCTKERSLDAPEISSKNQTDSNNDNKASVENQGVGKKLHESSSRNVFVKTTRMIFSPFRRHDERSTNSKKDNDRSRNKSRSVSPMITRQDAVVKTPLSLPWSSGSSSKDDETSLEQKADESNDLLLDVKSTRDGKLTSEDEETMQNSESIIEEEHKRECGADRALENTKVLKMEEKIDPKETPISVNWRTNMDLKNEPFKAKPGKNESSESCLRTDQKGKTLERLPFSVCNPLNRSSNVSHSSRIDGETTLVSPAAKSEALSSDLMHKLRILSNAAATRDGRLSTTSVDSASESRASRIRRAKESFLSRRGGPFCHSTLEEIRPTGRFDREESRGATCRSSSTIESFGKEEFVRTKDESAFVTRNIESSMIQTKTGAETVTERKDSLTKTTSNKAHAANIDSQPVSLNESDNHNNNNNNNNADSMIEDASVEASLSSRPDLVKSASAGMINVDPNTFSRLSTADRGCESLPRRIPKNKEASGPFARIVSKLKFSRSKRSSQNEVENMSTISKLCRQSLFVDVRSDIEEHHEGQEQEGQGEFCENANVKTQRDGRRKE